jgi:hypothetical protein
MEEEKEEEEGGCWGRRADSAPLLSRSSCISRSSVVNTCICGCVAACTISNKLKQVLPPPPLTISQQYSNLTRLYPALARSLGGVLVRRCLAPRSWLAESGGFPAFSRACPGPQPPNKKKLGCTGLHLPFLSSIIVTALHHRSENRTTMPAHASIPGDPCCARRPSTAQILSTTQASQSLNTAPNAH